MTPSAQTNYQMRGHVVPGRTIVDIRGTAESVRSIMKLGDKPPNLEHFLESLIEYGLTVDVLDDHNSTFLLSGVEAACIPESATIMLTSDTYAAARRNDPRTRFTIFHEMGHFVLSHAKTLHRQNIVPKPYIDSEWQADQFAAEMTMPLEVMRKHNLRTARALAQFCGVSLPAAAYRLKQLAKYNTFR